MLDERNDAPTTLSRGAMLRGVAATTAALGAMPMLPAMAADDTARIAKLLDINPKFSGKGQTYDIGMVFPLTGSGAIFGNRITALPKMAFSQIEAMGGPKFNVVLKDNVSGLATAGVQAVRELGAAHVPMELTSIVADLGSMLPGIKQYKIFSVDGSGGTSIFAQGKPYYWGALAITPDDAIPGIAKYVKAKMPNVKTVAIVGWDLGDLSVKVGEHMRQLFESVHVKYVAQELVTIGETDFSSPLQKIKSANPDLVMAPIYAEDQGYFLKQYATSGINKPIVTFASTPQAATIAGAAYELPLFAFDQFFPQKPSNPWASYFIDAHKGISGGALPDYYSANFYEELFLMWACIRRVLEAKGNPRDGAQLSMALQKNPKFPSVYGGSSTKAGTLEFNTTTHSVSKRPMSISTYKGGNFTPVATFNIGGADFKLA